MCIRDRSGTVLWQTSPATAATTLGRVRQATKPQLGSVATILCRAVAVSYTHLDVYKRQGNGNDLIYGGAGRDTLLGNGGADTIYGDKDPAGVTVPGGSYSVSYTHLDVYKRQERYQGRRSVRVWRNGRRGRLKICFRKECRFESDHPYQILQMPYICFGATNSGADWSVEIGRFPAPVSYTHLDVYKRQFWRRPMPRVPRFRRPTAMRSR